MLFAEDIVLLGEYGEELLVRLDTFRIARGESFLA